jgi:protein SCO1/2
MGAIGGVFIGVVVAGVAASSWVLHRVNADDSSAYRVAWGESHAPPGAALPVLWDAPQFAYTDENGRRFTSQDLRGHIWISDFFFSSCTNICPLMTLKMSQLLEKINVPSVQFVSFSVDPDYDTPKVLKEYAKGWKADETRWHFLSTDRQQLAQTAAGMKVFVSAPQKDRPIQHSSLFTLVDGNGKVRGVYDSNDESALNNLVAGALTLAGMPPPKSASAIAWADPGSDVKSDSPGANLYVACGCVACHSQGHVAPPLTGLFGSKVLLADGKTVTADENYLHRALLNPDSVRVAGYPRLMPNYRVQLSDEQVGQVIQYIESLASKPSASAGK